ncbi:hypothetical protein [Pseudomonas iridis]|uniref:hypothetical protein n=1 Tax=Pseudomonas iridis TaxID=2710587 RepID=UPI001E37AD9D|nr:hypothetical protein [Pseudomonas iridis]
MRYSLPPSLQGLEIELNPFAEDAEKHTRQWLKGLGLEASQQATHQLDIYLPGKYAGYMWPGAARDDLYILSDLTGWFSCQDDLADEDLSRAPDALETALRQVQKATLERGPSCSGLAGGLRISLIVRQSLCPNNGSIGRWSSTAIISIRVYALPYIG